MEVEKISISRGLRSHLSNEGEVAEKQRWSPSNLRALLAAALCFQWKEEWRSLD